MPWKTGSNSALGLNPANPATPDTPPATASLTPYFDAIGTIATFVEDTQGPCELIYLPGVANLAAGDMVVYDLTPGAQSVTRHTKDTSNNSGRSVAIAVGAPQAGQYGWYQIGGVALANAVAATAAGPMYGSATAGQISSTADAGDQILGARILTAVGTPSAGKVYASLNRPCIQPQIT